MVRRRRMVRAFDPDRRVPPDLRDRLLDHAIRAPSAGFTQGWAFLVLEQPAERDRFWRATAEPGPPDAWLAGLHTAPLLVACLSDQAAYLDRYAEPDKGWTDRRADRWPVPYWHVDTGMAALLMLLTAVDEGLAACFFGVPADRVAAFRAAFGVPDRLTPVGVVAVGFRRPDRRSPSLRRGRRPRSEVVHHGRW